MRISAFEKLAGRIIPDAPPEVVWDSASDTALRSDMSEQRVGKIINKLGIKNEEDMFPISLAKAPHSKKTIEMSEYSPAAVERIEAAIREWMAASSSR